MAHYDALTDLPNRVLFYEKMEELLDADRKRATSRSSAWTLTTLRASMIRLDIQSGISCCRRWPSACAAVSARPTSSLGWVETSLQSCRSHSTSRRTRSSLATRLIDAVSAPYQIDGHQVVVGTSIGIAIAPGDGTDPDQLMKNADLALYRCKADGGNKYQFFEAQNGRSHAERSRARSSQGVSERRVHA